MNENIDLTKILKDCPKGTKLYSSIFGEVYFKEIRSDDEYPIVTTKDTFTKEGLYRAYSDGECILFPSKEQRDWSKFTAHWYKKERFDHKTLNPFDKVLVRNDSREIWRCDFSANVSDDNVEYPYVAINESVMYCVPYNDDTKHLVGTTEEAPEYYRYWE